MHRTLFYIRFLFVFFFFDFCLPAIFAISGRRTWSATIVLIAKYTCRRLYT